jgi:hypothetical protein
MKMSTQETLSSTIIEWAATRTDESVIDPTHGYYPFAIIAEAFEKGIEHGEKNLKEKVRGHFFSNAGLVVEVVNKALAAFKELNFDAKKMFVNISFESSKIILTFDESTYVTDDFLIAAYDLSSELQLFYFDKGLKLDLSYLIDSKEINLEAIKSDGFEISIDLKTRKPIY